MHRMPRAPAVWREPVVTVKDSHYQSISDAGTNPGRSPPEKSMRSAPMAADPLQHDGQVDDMDANNADDMLLVEQFFHGSQALGEIREAMAGSMARLNDESRRAGEQRAVFATGAQQLARMEGTLGAIGQRATACLTGISNIDDLVTQVRQFVEVIDTISKQTNLLALNSAVEAARAGVHGKGFAVLATAVRELATETREAAHSISEAVSGMEEAAATAGGDVNDMATEAGTLAESTRSFSQDMKGLLDASQSLHDTVNIAARQSFINTVKMDHVVWKSELYRMIFGFSGKKLDEFADHTQCRLGKWYYTGEGAQLYRGNRAFQALDKPHAGVHQSGIEAARLASQGDFDGCRAALAAMERYSFQVMSALSDLAAD
ncbi:MAG: CZB domain-containing protein [Gammaproteobacteria bacterium]|nr:CZB domain-containing protein [Gammaproteobacteria bacterium]